MRAPVTAGARGRRGGPRTALWRARSRGGAGSRAGSALLRRARGHGSFLRLRTGQLARRERAIGIALAAEEDGATATAPADELALAAQRADHTGLLHGLLDVLAVRIAGA